MQVYKNIKFFPSRALIQIYIGLLENHPLGVWSSGSFVSEESKETALGGSWGTTLKPKSGMLLADGS